MSTSQRQTGNKEREGGEFSDFPDIAAMWCAYSTTALHIICKDYTISSSRNSSRMDIIILVLEGSSYSTSTTNATVYYKISTTLNVELQ